MTQDKPLQSLAEDTGMPVFEISVEIRTKRVYRIQAPDEEAARSQALERVAALLPDREIIDLRRVRADED